MAPLSKWISFKSSTNDDHPEISYDEVESLDGEKQHIRSVPASTNVKILCWINAGLLVTVWILAVMVLRERGWSWKVPGRQAWWSKDIIDKGGEIPVTFWNSYNYSDFDFPSIRNLYNRYPHTEEMLAVAVPDAEKYDLPPGFPTLADPQVGSYGVAFTHQFHCITMWRDSYYHLRHQLNKVPPNFVPPPNAMKKYEESENEHFYHIEHCMDYLRQTVACWADTTLEGPEPHPDGSRINVDGMGMKHQCWDVDAVRKRFQSRLVPMRQVLKGERVE